MSNRFQEIVCQTLIQILESPEFVGQAGIDFRRTYAVTYDVFRSPKQTVIQDTIFHVPVIFTLIKMCYSSSILQYSICAVTGIGYQVACMLDYIPLGHIRRSLEQCDQHSYLYSPTSQELIELLQKYPNFIRQFEQIPRCLFCDNTNSYFFHKIPISIVETSFSTRVSNKRFDTWFFECPLCAYHQCHLKFFELLSQPMIKRNKEIKNRSLYLSLILQRHFRKRIGNDMTSKLMEFVPRFQRPMEFDFKQQFVSKLRTTFRSRWQFGDDACRLLEQVDVIL